MEGIPQPGELVGGRFVVETVLGAGGMGVVVSARHVQLGQTVAIKFLRHGALSNPEAVNWLLREARALVGLRSAHVVRVMDVGTMDDGLPYMVMEHLSGTDLGQSLEARGVLPVEEAVDCLVQAMDAVAEAHTVGIVHRDLKPSNLFLTLRPDGSSLVKVLDFGISGRRGGAPRQSYRDDHGVGLAALHVARTSSQHQERRHAHGRVGAGGDPLRTRRWIASVRSGHRHGPLREDRRGPSGAFALAKSGYFAGARSHRRALPRQVSFVDRRLRVT